MKSFSMKCSGLAFALAITGAMFAPAAEAVNLATDGIGEVGVAPYYTVRSGWLSLINITNTADESVVVKVHFLEARNSRDVFNFTIALSPFDVFTAIIRDTALGPQLEVTDLDPVTGALDTCLIPHQQFFTFSTLGRFAFSGVNDDGGPGGDTPFAPPPNANAIDRMREGYIVFVSEGHTVSIPGPDLDIPAGETVIGNQIINHDCVAVSTAFRKLTASNSVILNTARQFGEPINSLKFDYRLINPVRGLELSGSPVTWANFFNPGFRVPAVTGIGVPPSTINVADHLLLPADNATCTITRGDERPPTSNPASPITERDWDPQGAGSGVPAPGISRSCMNLITAQDPSDFLEPSLNDAYPVRGNWWDDTLNQVINVFPSTLDPYRIVGPNALPGFRGVDALSATIQRASIINEWSLESFLGVSTAWVVTLPTKGFYVDQAPSSLPQNFAIVSFARDEAEYCAQIPPGVCGPGNLGVPYPPFAAAFGQERPGDRFSAKSCNGVRFARYDRAENTLNQNDDVVPSPAGIVPRERLCYEANVITFSTTPAFTSGPLDATDRDPLASDTQVLDVGGLLPAESGWVSLVLDESPWADPLRFVAVNGLGAVHGGLERWSGLPAIGYTVKSRIFGNVSKNTSSIVDHGYKRCFNQHLDEAGVRCIN